MSETSSTLLVRLRNEQDHAAWADFQRVYARLIGHWVRKYGVTGADAEDLTQDVLLALLSAFRTGAFVLDRRKGHFRSFLMVTVRNRAINFLRHRGRQPQHVALIDAADAPPDRSVDRTAEAEYRTRLLEECLAAVRPQFDDATWDCFLGRSYHDEPAKKIAARHCIPHEEVYRRAYRVLRALQEYASGLDPDLFPAS